MRSVLAATVPAAAVKPMARRRLPLSYIVAMVPIAAAVNLVGDFIVTSLRIPIFLDMTGTAICAFALGPWWAAVTGLLTNMGEGILISPSGIPFAVINMLGGILWGYGARYLTKDFPRLLLFGIVTGLACGVAATPIVALVFGGATGAPSDMVIAGFLAGGSALFSAALYGTVITNVADKIISVFFAVAVVTRLPTAVRGNLQLSKLPTARIMAYAVIGVLVGVVLTILIAIGTL